MICKSCQFVIVIVLFLLQSSCYGGDLREDCLIYVQGHDSKKIRTQVVSSESERSLGLMYRKHIDSDQGMLFVFPNEDERSFWMKNTFIPLDMIFIGEDGSIRRVLKNVPPHTTVPRKSGAAVKYVLEVSGGVADDNGFKEGQRLDLESCKNKS